MKLDHIPLDRLYVDKTNMRFGRKAPDVSDILPTIRARGVIQTLLVRPPDAEGRFGVVAGSRGFHACRIVADERREAGNIDPEALLLPCAIMEEGDDAAAIEASMIENMARLDADEVRQWESFTRLVREGRGLDDIAMTFGLPELSIRRVLALGNLLPRIRDLYRTERIERGTVRHLTLASKSQQKAWLALFDDADAYVPTGHQLKAWLFGGQSIPARFALFDIDGFTGATVADLFGEDRYFADPDTFWTAQNAAIEASRGAYLDEGWADVVVVPPAEHFHSWEFEKAAKRKGGRVYIDVRGTGEVTFHEGYVTRAEARRIERGEAACAPKAQRPELTSTLQTYVDLHRHAAVRAALIGHPALALRLMLAHAIVGSSLWTVRVEPQATRNDEVRESVETSRGEAVFDTERRVVLDTLGFAAEEPAVTGGNGDDHGVAGLFLRLAALPDEAVMRAITVVIGETLAAGSAAVEAVGEEVGIDMADWWQADEALFALLRDREVLGRMTAEVAGATVANANAGEKTKTLKRIIADHLGGAEGRDKVERWVPRWMQFPPSAYTERGGVGTVAAHAEVVATRQTASGQCTAECEEEEEQPLPQAA
ncbi:ParB/RepB/Spo0J family partition protein [Novosphingobium resinovorum]|uniref:ParB/RepB/Spo0J family partition protein n=1 Tax=Novosphingobium resinovorum TaxID=158500 RepID=UPI002ED49EC9|nr:ParB N-terminal domain-containing protein [Novosphingobium resinovorum]